MESLIRLPKLGNNIGKRWSGYCARFAIDPFLSNESELQQIIVLAGFAAMVRTGTYGSRGGVAALARRVHHILQNGGNDDSFICDYFTNGNCLAVTPKQLIVMIRAAIKTLRLDTTGIEPDLVGVHSLRAGGAMALKLNDYADTTIQKLGRWLSLMFLQYIHNQIPHLSSGIAAK